ncbi:unnamed protein product [Candidula unifasciata]|uniref:thiopurine S-methyltransferase n=1 Tax=Candidula unifasciata TaxID=100452 RepID=A0A8S3YVA1_9EUPU|nr:unnamed protein product [Candidula unifasciata]
MSSETLHPDDQISHWKDRWDKGQIGFHRTYVNPALQRHVEKLIPEAGANAVFFPLCGKSVDMKWMADRGLTVIGVEGVQSAIEQFFHEQLLDYVVDEVPSAGSGAKVYQSHDGRIRLYHCDIFHFTSELEGTVDAVVDKNSLIALPRKDVPRYVQVIKNMLSPGGRILLDVVEYELSLMDEVEGPNKPPPPFPMYEEELKTLYGPEFSVEFLERNSAELRGKQIYCSSYLLIKKS